MKHNACQRLFKTWLAVTDAVLHLQTPALIQSFVPYFSIDTSTQSDNGPQGFQRLKVCASTRRQQGAGRGVAVVAHHACAVLVLAHHDARLLRLQSAWQGVATLQRNRHSTKQPCMSSHLFSRYDNSAKKQELVFVLILFLIHSNCCPEGSRQN